MKAWVFKYLHYLNLHKNSPSKLFLLQLYQHHLARVPYEVTSKFFYAQTNQYIPTTNEFVQNLLERGWGGDCYILNIQFMRLLNELGFQGFLVEVTPGHIAIIVTIEEQDYFVDVGYGAPLNQLVPIQDDTWVRTIYGEKIVIKQTKKNQFQYDRLYKGGVFVSKTIHIKSIEEEDVQADIETSFRDHEDNVFMRRVSMALTAENMYTWVRNNRITIRTNNKEEEIIEYSNSCEWVDAIHKLFGLRKEDLHWTIEFLKHRDVDLGFTQ